MKENAVPKGTKDAAKSKVTVFEGKIWKLCDKVLLLLNTCDPNSLVHLHLFW